MHHEHPVHRSNGTEVGSYGDVKNLLSGQIGRRVQH